MPLILGLAQSALAVVACMALGLLLEEGASRKLLFLDAVTLGPSPLAADVDLGEPVPKPHGEHGWIPIPLAVLDVGLLLLSDYPDGIWSDDSWWGSCRGLIWGQLPTLAVCTFTIAPALLAAWLLWMPWHCSALPVTLAAVLLVLGLASILFWSDALPLLPRARVRSDIATRSVRRSLLYALHAPLFAACTHLLWDHHGDAKPPGCAALLDQLQQRPSAFGAALAEQLQAQTPQGQHTPLQFALQLAIAVLCVHVLIDTPRPAPAPAPREKSE